MRYRALQFYKGNDRIYVRNLYGIPILMPITLSLFFLFFVTLLSCKNTESSPVSDIISQQPLVQLEEEMLNTEKDKLSKNPRPRVIQIKKQSDRLNPTKDQ